MAQRSARRGRDNQRNPECFQHATGVMDPARELPYRPAADHRRIRGRTDGSIRLRATTILKFSLAWEGVSTDGFRSFAGTRRNDEEAPKAANSPSQRVQRGISARADGCVCHALIRILFVMARLFISHS